MSDLIQTCRNRQSGSMKIQTCRVLAGRYGEVGGIIAEEGRFNSVWWNNLINIKNGVGVGGGRWFDDNVGREVGDGAHTLFWWDPWIDGLVLKNSFGRLFDLANNKMATVAEMYSLGWGEEGEVWKWRRRLFAWEEEKVLECCDILTNIVLQPNHYDRWIWHLHASNNYNVTSAYNHLLTLISNNLSATHTSEIWNKEVPLKISLFAWRLLRDRLPTTDNLIKRHILLLNAQLCVGGCGMMGDAKHLFLSCDFFGKLWYGISHWLSCHIVFPEHVPDHLYQFGTLGGFSKNNRSAFHLIWLSCVWVIWLERNARVFHQTEASINQLLDKVKLQSYWWLKANRPSFVFSYHSWWLNPLPCLGIIM
ncbi:putative reverse transcriptase zinc-binding domain-containing protein [Medicago truncatula]|uniref:Putative reverse transcriptase zinc-binding domain-containing protein n=1 Tax=Medicago truncatula TaxID=3880 RepID=A0A396JTR3_MEDTR|nr:uncharacterized protein LOC112419861 [Medicago truncatula]RHN79618.1 putative reverse transcriptase zinc-binding domain-containing protein [Medicago truncatula]